MNQKKIEKIELAVHLFHEINFIDKYPHTKYNSKYTQRDEKIMKKKYFKKIDKLANEQETYLLFVSHAPLSKGIIHENTYDIYMHILEKIPDRHYPFDFSVEPKSLEKLIPKIDNNTTIRAWGEYTSGCVLNELLRTKYSLGMQLCPKKSLEELNTNLGVDFVYPRQWEIQKIGYEDFEKRFNEYIRNVFHNFRYYMGEEEIPKFS